MKDPARARRSVVGIVSMASPPKVRLRDIDMNRSTSSSGNNTEKLSLKLGIVGGGRACKYFLELLDKETLPHLDINLVGVCDINDQAEGIRLARKMGIYVTGDYKDLFNIDGLDGIIELTNSREVLLELVNHRPKRVAIIEHNIGRFIRSLYLIDQQLKSAEKQVMMEKMISEFLIQQAKQRIIVLNTDFTIEDINEAYLEILGKKREEVIGEYCYQLIQGKNEPCTVTDAGFECPMVETLRTGESAHVIHEDPISKDRPAYNNILTYPVKNNDGEIVRIIEIWRDITQEMVLKMENRVRELKSDLNKLVQEDRLISLGKLAASCVHEINNPIQGLLTFSHLIQESLAQGPPAGEELEKLGRIVSLMSNELDRCGRIVSGLLSFSRENPMEYTDLDLNDILEAVIALTQHKIELQGISLTTDLSEKILPVRGDRNQLQQCFLNLIFNAIEAMSLGGGLNITSRINRERTGAVVEIRDTGYGIPTKNIDHIYDPFFTTKDTGEGTGLGLSIVYGVVKDHNGRIEVKSSEGEGATFKLNFPLQR